MKTIAFLALTLLSCTHVSRFSTDSPGAKLYIDDQYVGKTPTDFSEKTGSKSYRIRIEQDGFETLETSLSQNELNTDALLAGAALGGATFCGGCAIGTFGCCWPVFYSIAVAGPVMAGYMVYKNKQLKDEYMFELVPQKIQPRQ